MKALNLLLIPILLAGSAGAQTPVVREKYTILSTGFGEFFPYNPGHDVSASFPYTVTDVATASTSQQNFNGALHGKFTRPSYMLDLLKLEFVRKRNSIDMGVGLFQEAGGDHGYYVKGGYGYILPIGDLLLRPAIDLFYVSGVDKMGSIDNNQKELGFPGFVASDAFTLESTDGDGYTSDDTYEADHVDVNYRRYSFLARPGIELRTRPIGRLAFSLDMGWMFQLAQRSVLQFEQKAVSSTAGNNLGSISQEKNGLLNGPYIALNIGLYIWPKKA